MSFVLCFIASYITKQVYYLRFFLVINTIPAADINIKATTTPIAISPVFGSSGLFSSTFPVSSEGTLTSVLSSFLSSSVGSFTFFSVTVKPFPALLCFFVYYFPFFLCFFFIKAFIFILPCN